MHSPIIIKNLTLSFPHKTCFADFSTQISFGSRIAIIGRNGSGKSTLLKMLAGLIESDITPPANAVIAYVPQILDEFSDLSGSERLNLAITRALSLDPNVLLLDEPTNHLDIPNRQSLLRKLASYSGTLIVASHDQELLRGIDALWHIDNGKIHEFLGNYDDYMREILSKRASIERDLARVQRQKKDTHESLMKEQVRAAKSKKKGQKSILERKWPTMVSDAKAARAEMTTGRKKSAIEQKKQDLLDRLQDLRLPEIIVPKFSIDKKTLGPKVVFSVSNGSVGYFGEKPVLTNINLSLNDESRIAIIGKNASGKSTLVKAIMGDTAIITEGVWLKPSQVGYLDQHYQTLNGEKTAFETIAELMPLWSMLEVRAHLNDFLFRKNEEVSTPIKMLSGGEKARLSLAQIAAMTPRLLILDEVTNNLDLETKNHMIEVLKAYPGALLVISHDEDFLGKIDISDYYLIEDGLGRVSGSCPNFKPTI